MMEFKGTKGKWFVTEGGLSVSNIENKRNIHDGTICRFHTGVFNYANYKADALLISKAPEMLEMLKRVNDLIKHLGGTHYCQYSECEQLIKEATELS
ncbi:hypothetical protein [Chryseobacterium daeguense]|uniref:hypothetical protein n=1 Tax=Chryseobacterium daeguense TaxID=412438 RepID=UPI00042A2E91|nr:hypothetical protein [Chryseobacterium daeguense]